MKFMVRKLTTIFRCNIFSKHDHFTTEFSFYPINIGICAREFFQWFHSAGELH